MVLSLLALGLRSLVAAGDTHARARGQSSQGDAGKDTVSWSSHSPSPPALTATRAWRLPGSEGGRASARPLEGDAGCSRPTPRTPGRRSALPASGASPSAQTSLLPQLSDLGYEKGPSFLSPQRARRTPELVSPTSSRAVALTVGPQDRPTAPETRAPQRLTRLRPKRGADGQRRARGSVRTKGLTVSTERPYLPSIMARPSQPST